MKPLHLQLQAFGSFPGLEEIDFESLAPRGLFVVSGDTGSGKTTIFDAMCWALYGEMPLKEAAGARSHHAAPTTETFVKLTFECEGELYVVTRNPEQRRAPKVGDKSVLEKFVLDQAKATLVRVIKGTTEPLATTAIGASKRCVELVGLSAEQFQRVILLPQGEFSKFLLASSTEREGLLGQLFGGSVFDRIVEELKQGAAALRTELGSADGEIAAQLTNARTHVQRVYEQLGLEIPEALADTDRGAVAELRDGTSAPLDVLRGEVARLTKAAEELVVAHQTALAEATRFEKAAEQRARLAELNEAEGSVATSLAEAVASAAARPVVSAADALDQANSRLAAASADREEQVGLITEAFAGLGVEVDGSSATAISDLLRSHQAQHDSNRLALGALGLARADLATAETHRVQLAESVTSHRSEVATVSVRLTEIDAALPAVRERAVDRDSLQAHIDTASERVTARTNLDRLLVDLTTAVSKEAEAVTTYDTALAGFVATQAPRLAEELTDGAPCPVCGSVDHPAPATVSGGEPTTFDQVEKTGMVKDAAAAAAKSIHNKVTKSRASLGEEADLPIDALEVQAAALRALLVEAKAAHLQLAALEDDQTAKTGRCHELEKLLAGLAAEVTGAQSIVEQRRAGLAEAERTAAGLDEEQVALTGTALGRILEATNGLENRFTAVTSASGAVTNADTAFSTALTASEFDTVDDAHAALLPAEEEHARRGTAEQHAKELAEVRGSLKTLEDQGVPAERPDVGVAEAAARAADVARNARTEIHTTARNAHADAETALDEHDALLGASGDLRVRHEDAERAWRVCNKGGALNMSLTRWVLGRELDRVTAAANIHLGRMTGHLYSLRRSEEITDGRRGFGLDLEALDASTGRPRSTRSLSGGEQFQASLALALGLADVVSHGGSASGKRFEALFVDEGFGSLDPASLDEAINALHQLHATGRMVGAITHVEEMKKQLHVGIEVTRLPDGGGSTLVVHP